MWVDIFPKNTSLPSPADITPHEPEPYILRVIVYNTVDVLLDETSIVSGEDMSDIYVKVLVNGVWTENRADYVYKCINISNLWGFFEIFIGIPHSEKLNIHCPY